MLDIKSAMVSLHQRPVAVYPVHIKIMGSISGGYFLSQIMYWFSAMDGKSFYKTDEDFEKELYIPERTFKRLKCQVKKLPFLKLVVEGRPSKTYYEIDYDKYFRLISKLKMDDSDFMKCQNGTLQSAKMAPYYITEINKTKNSSSSSAREKVPQKQLVPQLLPPKNSEKELEEELSEESLTDKTIKVSEDIEEDLNQYTLDCLKETIKRKKLKEEPEKNPNLKQNPPNSFLTSQYLYEEKPQVLTSKGILEEKKPRVLLIEIYDIINKIIILF